MKRLAGTVCVDSNVLVYAQNADGRYFGRANEVIQAAANGEFDAVVALQNVLEFFATITDRKRVEKPLSVTAAMEEVAKIVRGSVFRVLYPNLLTVSWWEELTEVGKRAVGQRVYDRFLAATMLTNGVKIIITENKRDFAGIKGLTAVSLAEL